MESENPTNLSFLPQTSMISYSDQSLPNSIPRKRLIILRLISLGLTIAIIIFIVLIIRKLK
jgi:hypothetical protein